jgi:hypothetical protein
MTHPNGYGVRRTNNITETPPCWVPKELERKQREVEEILKKKKEEEERKRRELEAVRQREESIRLKKAAEERRRLDEEDRRRQEEEEERRQRLEEQRRQQQQQRDESSGGAESAPTEALPEKSRAVAQEQTTTGAVPAHVEIRLQAKQEARMSSSRPSSRSNLRNLFEGGGAAHTEAADASAKHQHAKDSSELVRLQNRLLQKHQRGHGEHLLEPSDIFQTNEANGGQERFSMSNRWKDVKIGLVKDRASSYLLKPSMDENQNFCCQPSPRSMRRKILSPAAWYAKQASPPPPQHQAMESYHNAVNVQKKQQSGEKQEAAAVSRLILDSGEEKENLKVTAAAGLGMDKDSCCESSSTTKSAEAPEAQVSSSLDKDMITSKIPVLPAAKNSVEIGRGGIQEAAAVSAIHGQQLSSTSHNIEVPPPPAAVAASSQETPPPPPSLAALGSSAQVTSTRDKVGEIAGDRGSQAAEGESIPAEVHEDDKSAQVTAEGQLETTTTAAPWRRQESSRSSRNDLVKRSPSLNLMSVSVTPCRSGKDLSPRRSQLTASSTEKTESKTAAVKNECQPAAAAESIESQVAAAEKKNEIKTAAAATTMGVVVEAVKDKRSGATVVERLDETMKELQQHAEALGG